MALVSSRPRAQFTPAGVLRLPLPAAEAPAVLACLKDALGELISGGASPAPQPLATGINRGDPRTPPPLRGAGRE